MPKFGKTSTKRLETCDARLQRLFQAVVQEFDCTVITGHRPLASQQELFDANLSKVRFSMHNVSPDMGGALAADVTPYPIDWDDIERHYHFAGYVRRVAFDLAIPLRWGGDWDGDTIVKDQSFMDLVHYELIVPFNELPDFLQKSRASK